MKNITIAGRVGKDAEARRLNDGTPVLNFTVAVDDGFGDRKTTMWFDVSVWGKRGDSLASIIKKGMPLTVTGDLSRREHEGKTYLTVRTNEITLQGGGKSEDKTANERIREDRAPVDLDDEIPF